MVTVNPEGLLSQTETDGTASTVELGLYCGNVFTSRDASLAAAGCADEAGPVAVVVDLANGTEFGDNSYLAFRSTWRSARTRISGCHLVWRRPDDIGER